MARVARILERCRLNIYDSTDSYESRDLLFGNRNVGVAKFTNLQISGQFPRDQTACIVNWYARTDMARTDEARRDFDAMMHAATATLYIGCRATWLRSMSDLLRTPMWAPDDVNEKHLSPEENAEIMARHEEFPPLVIPVRQNFEVHVEFDADLFKRSMGAHALPRVWVHLEGTMTRDVY